MYTSPNTNRYANRTLFERNLPYHRVLSYFNDLETSARST